MCGVRSVPTTLVVTLFSFHVIPLRGGQQTGWHLLRQDATVTPVAHCLGIL